MRPPSPPDCVPQDREGRDRHSGLHRLTPVRAHRREFSRLTFPPAGRPRRLTTSPGNALRPGEARQRSVHSEEPPQHRCRLARLPQRRRSRSSGVTSQPIGGDHDVPGWLERHRVDSTGAVEPRSPCPGCDGLVHRTRRGDPPSAAVHAAELPRRSACTSVLRQRPVDDVSRATWRDLSAGAISVSIRADGSTSDEDAMRWPSGLTPLTASVRPDSVCRRRPTTSSPATCRWRPSGLAADFGGASGEGLPDPSAFHTCSVPPAFVRPRSTQPLSVRCQTRTDW